MHPTHWLISTQNLTPIRSPSLLGITTPSHPLCCAAFSNPTMRTRWPARTGDSSDASLTGDLGEGGPRPSSQALARALTGVEGDAIGSGGDAFAAAGGGGGDEKVVGGGGGTSGSGSGGGGARAISPDDIVTTL